MGETKESISDLIAVETDPKIVIEDLQKENDELKARLYKVSTASCEVCIYLNENKYNTVGSKSILHRQLEDALNKTPQQNLSEIKAQAIEELIESIEWSNYGRSIKNQILDYANKLRGQK